MLHHLTLGVSDLARSAGFYDAVLTPLGYGRVWTDAGAVGYGPPEGAENFAIELAGPGDSASSPRFHVAFRAPSREALAEFHRTALAHGGRDNPSPGMHHDHDEHFYPVHLFDPDGHRIEAVFTDRT